ncbi:MAG: hypothetical protein OXB95_12475 [Rhodobacteraceae bacterium]|nr:hypothetical protein [Paracoccaceae bacterium]
MISAPYCDRPQTHDNQPSAPAAWPCGNDGSKTLYLPSREVSLNAAEYKLGMINSKMRPKPFGTGKLSDYPRQSSSAI